jgi:dipeptidyl aminopeptidase/acylaminoacyl peptidase
MNTQVKFYTVLIAGSLMASAANVAQSSAPLQPITHETLWMMKRVGAPAASPDGKWVVYSIVEPSYEPDKAVSDLWLASIDGLKPPRRITNTKAPEGSPAWSPDSSSIAFTTKRETDESEQVYVLNLSEGGEARRLTNISTGASNPKWRPDGKAILFESFVYPNAMDDEANKKVAADRKARKYNVRTYEHFPIRFWNQWLDDRQPTLMVQSIEPGSSPKDILSATVLARTSGFAGAETDTSVTLAPIWSPDGHEVVFTATTERWHAAYGHVGYHLYRMPADGGEPRIATPASGEYQGARFSPDGKSLFFKYEVQDAEIYHLPRLCKISWPAGGESLLVARDFDREPAHYALTPDSKLIYLLVPEAGKDNLYQVSAAGGNPTRVIEPAMGGYTSLEIPEKAAKTILVGAYGSSVSPSEIVRIDPSRRSHTNLTEVNTAFAKTIDWQAPQHFYFTSAKGRNIHNMIVLPPAFDASKKYPTLVLIHGGAASNNPDQIGLRWNYHLLAAPGYVILMTDYTGSTSFGEKFAQAIKLDPLKTPGDEINQAVDEAINRYPFIDGSRLCAAGASYGGHLANWIEATTTRYKCIVSHAGEVDLVSQWGTSDSIYGREVNSGSPIWGDAKVWREQSPVLQGGNRAAGTGFATPILITVGEQDFRVPMNNAIMFFALQQRLQVPSKLIVFPEETHWIQKAEDHRYWFSEVQAWLAKYLK